MIDTKQIDKAVDLIAKSDVNYKYFFEHLSKASWIRPLRERGYFTQPPPRIEAEGSISFPFWPESRYLLKVVKQAPEDVLEMGLICVQTNNERVHEDFTEAACKMPVDLAAKWALAETEWIEDQDHLYMNLPYHLSDLIEYLAINGESQTALALAKTLFQLFPLQRELPEREPESEDNEIEEIISIPSLEPIARFEQHGIYTRLLPKSAQALIGTEPVACVSWLSELLDHANELSTREKDSHDYSHIWRPRISDDPEQNLGYDIRDPIVSALRNSIVVACRADATVRKPIIAILSDEKYQGQSIFRRLLFYLLRTVEDIDHRYRQQVILNPDMFTSYGSKDEYILLVGKFFQYLETPDRQTYFEMVTKKESDELARFTKSIREQEDRDPNPDEIQDFTDKFLIDQLEHIKGFLPKALQARYNSAKERQKSYQPTAYDFTVEPAEFIGTKSPLTVEDLNRWTHDEIIEYLKTWIPEGFINSPSRDGLATTITQAVQINPKRFTYELQKYIGVHPTYIRGLVEGFQNSLRENLELNWQPILALCLWIAEQPREFPPDILKDSENHFREDQDWGWTRSRVLDLLEDGLKEKHHSKIPFDYRESVWSIIRLLSTDPDPSPESEQELSKPFDAATSSINTVRGRAMHACMAYIMWVRRHIQANETLTDDQITFEQLPEVIEVLNDHVDTDRDCTLTIHSVYGKWLPWLIAWDEQWVKDKKMQIFPSEIDKQAFWDVAWGTYVVYNRPYNNAFLILEDIYEEAFTRLDTIDISLAGARSVDESLAEHLLVFYGRGVGKERIKELLEKFYGFASKQVREYAMRYAGDLTQGTDVYIEAIQKLKDFWDWRLSTALASDKISEFEGEISEFGRWIPSANLEDEWILDQIEIIMNHFSRFHASEESIGRLVCISDTNPQKALDILKWLFDSKCEPWDYYLWRKPTMELLSKTLKSSKKVISDQALDIINHLVAKGHLEYRELSKD